MKLKKAKREEATQYRDSFMKDWKENLKKKVSQDKKNELSKGDQPWKFVVQNIGTKASDYPGEQDITRMREAIIGKAEDSK